MTSQYEGIFEGTSPEVGKLRLAAMGIGWRALEGSREVSVTAADIKWARWLRVARGFQLRIGLKESGKKQNFEGFHREEFDKLSNLIKQHFDLTLEAVEGTFRGWNWGVTDFQGDKLAFLVANKTSFELPMDQVANSNIAGKTEVSVEFQPSKGKKSAKSPDELAEIRFYVPGTHVQDVVDSDGEAKGKIANGDDSDDEELTAAKAFHAMIKEKAEIGQYAGDIVIQFSDTPILTPRGRYDLDLFTDVFRMRGKTYDYRIAFSSISRLFLLPKDDLHVLFILGLSVPIQQGQTRYSFLVMQFSRDEEITAELNMSDEQIESYDKLEKSHDGLTFEVVSNIFRSLAKKRITGPGSYQSTAHGPSVKANLKTVQGDLFFLEKFVFFVSKQLQLIENSDIHQAIFSRVGGGIQAGRTFDLEIVTVSGPEFTFSSINKEEQDGIEQYLRSKKVKVKVKVPDVEIAMAAAVADDSEDEDMQSVASSEDEAPKPRKVNDDDDDESEDESFQASSSDGGSPSESGSDSDGAASDASGDKVIAKKPAKKKKDADGETPKKKKKKPVSKDAAGDDSMFVDDEEPSKPKSKPRPKKRDDDEGPKKKKAKTED